MAILAMSIGNDTGWRSVAAMPLRPENAAPALALWAGCLLQATDGATGCRRSVGSEPQLSGEFDLSPMAVDILQREHPTDDLLNAQGID